MAETVSSQELPKAVFVTWAGCTMMIGTARTEPLLLDEELLEEDELDDELLDELPEPLPPPPHPVSRSNRERIVLSVFKRDEDMAV